MDEVINRNKIQQCGESICVFCENLDYQKADYETLCYKHKIKLLWG